MAVDVRRGGNVAVAQPLLDQLHLHALCDKERRAGVAQIVEADVLESVLLQNPLQHALLQRHPSRGKKQLRRCLVRQVI